MDLTNFNFKPIKLIQLEKYFKEKLTVLVELKNSNRKYNAKILDIDKYNNILVRYCGDSSENSWTGNDNGMSGLDPNIYHGTCIGDAFNDFENLSKEHFVENGYDDIIEFEYSNPKIFKVCKYYPYLLGNYGNKHVHKYYQDLDNITNKKNIKNAYIPSTKICKIPTILENILDSSIKFRGKAYKNNIGIIHSLIKTIRYENNICDYYAEVESPENILNDFLKYISLQLNTDKIKSFEYITECNSNKNLNKKTDSKIYEYKELLYNGITIDNDVLLTLASIIFNRKIYVYSLIADTDDIEIMEYTGGTNESIYIYKIGEYYEPLF